MMTVAELIAKLQEFPSHLDVALWTPQTQWTNATTVQIDEFELPSYEEGTENRVVTISHRRKRPDDRS